MTRNQPNILVTGTPGTGKTTLCSRLVQDHPQLNLRHINVGDLVREKELHHGWDDDLQCYIIDEDKVIDELEPLMENGGIILDYHGCDFFPERWFDCVVVLQTDNSVLYGRLEKRGYTGLKLQKNIECEIFQVLLEEAHDSYSKDIIMSVKSNTDEDVNKNVDMLKEWVASWRSRE